MEYAALIHDFVDGTLEVSEEDRLFAELASSPGLRTELKQFIEFECAARFDTIAYTPGAESTANIFKSLDIGIGGSYVPETAAPVSKPVVTGFISKFRLPLISSLATAVATIAIMLFLQNYGGGDSKSTLRQAPGALNQVQDTEKQQIPVISIKEENVQKLNAFPGRSLETSADKSGSLGTSGNGYWNLGTNDNKSGNLAASDKAVQQKVIIKYVDKPVYIEKPTDIKEALSNMPETINNSFILAVDNKEEKPIVTEGNWAIPSYYSNSSDLKPNLDEILSVQPESYSIIDNFSIGFTDGKYWQFPRSIVSKSSDPLFENVALQLFYDLSSDFNVGLDVRQEFFYQRYSGYEKAVEQAPSPVPTYTQYNYYQHTNYISLGALLRYQPFEYSWLSPFGQLYFGGNKIGYIGRVMVGFETSPAEKLSFIIGLEGSLLYYYHQDEVQGRQWFNSPKLGLHYGVRFH